MHSVVFCTVLGPSGNCVSELHKAAAPHSALDLAPIWYGMMALLDTSRVSTLITGNAYNREDHSAASGAKGMNRWGNRTGQKELDRHWVLTAMWCSTLWGNFAGRPIWASGEKNNVSVQGGGLSSINCLVRPMTWLTHTLDCYSVSCLHHSHLPAHLKCRFLGTTWTNYIRSSG